MLLNLKGVRRSSLFMRIIRFFFCLRVSSASPSYEGAITTSKNSLFISAAVAVSMLRLAMIIPPNADTGSAAKASFHASHKLSLDAQPHALLCFSIATVGSVKSPMSSMAASMSSRLLYEISLPCNCCGICRAEPKKCAFWWGFSP
ncbi:hypothetical protein SDC9_138126 [bioreactor metagenome]|uniref:Uncharacterized protein n=1 Tax=bioreactor metagenome TaxID=1076179 RepID=A0A645DNZ8_9ZZZZ